MTGIFDAAELLDLDRAVRAVAGAEILPYFRKLPAGGVWQKSGPTDLVTIADEGAEAAIETYLRQQFPGALIVGEEGASRRPGMIDSLRDAALGFVIDPIDGTANFAAGVPLFGVMIAIVANGETIGAIIHDPIAQSSSLALRGGGARERDAAGQEHSLRVAPPPATLAAARGMVSWRFMPPDRRAKVLALLPSLGGNWDHRCAAHEYRQLISGHSDFVMFNRLLPWDHLPGVLLHAEAGGAHLRFDGSPYRVGDVGGGLIAAADRDTCEKLRLALMV
jgi:fructose-1,6-bisphosphatase/inositol monophosphatase family enzyme